jgi:hypothetical protein
VVATPTFSDNEDDVSYTGHKPRPTIYNGIRMRSRLEAEFARWLEINGPGRWTYEPEAYSNINGTYLPDFAIDGYQFAEVKPANHTEWDATFRKMHIILSSVPDAVLTVFHPRAWDGEGYTGWKLVGICKAEKPCGNDYCPRTAS